MAEHDDQRPVPVGEPSSASASVERAEMLEIVVGHTADSIVRFDPRLRYDYVNDLAVRLSGISREQFLGSTQADLGFPSEDVEIREERLTKVFVTGEATLHLDPITNQDGERWYETTLLPQMGPTGGVEHVVVVSRDITSRKLAEDALVRAAAQDPLTGLANRTSLLDVLQQAIEAGRESLLATAVLLIDLDRFKLVNDALGHAVGDRLLQLAAERILATVPPDDLVARHGGDEYVVVLRDLEDPAAAVHVANSVVEAFRRPLLSGDTELSTTASVGISVTAATRDRGATGPIDANDLIREADTAMYLAKANGRDSVSVFDETLRAAVDQRLRTENQLRGALARGELELWYQPEIDLGSHQIVSVEALLRWRLPSGEVVPASQFIGVAEDSGLVAPIGSWAIDQACRQAATWQERGLVIRVNLAPRQLKDPNLLRAFDTAVDRWGCPPERLCMEITETALLDDTPVAARNLEGLTQRGVSVALDDFGTGYASLTYLRRYHIDGVKLDRSFVTHIATSERDQRLAAAVVAMASHLRVTVTAEGVETEAQARTGAALGCTGAQGYLWSPALPADEFEAFHDRTVRC